MAEKGKKDTLKLSIYDLFRFFMFFMFFSYKSKNGQKSGFFGCVQEIEKSEGILSCFSCMENFMLGIYTQNQGFQVFQVFQVVPYLKNMKPPPSFRFRNSCVKKIPEKHKQVFWTFMFE